MFRLWRDRVFELTDDRSVRQWTVGPAPPAAPTTSRPARSATHASATPATVGLRHAHQTVTRQTSWQGPFLAGLIMEEPDDHGEAAGVAGRGEDPDRAAIPAGELSVAEAARRAKVSEQSVVPGAAAWSRDERARRKERVPSAAIRCNGDMVDDGAALARTIIDGNSYMVLGTADAGGSAWVSPAGHRDLRLDGAPR